MSGVPPESTLSRFAAPARRPAGWWRPVAGMAVILAAWVGGIVVVLGGWVVWQTGLGGGPEAVTRAVERVQHASDPAAIVAVLGSFAGIWFGVALALAAFHDRPLGSVFGPRGIGGFWRGLMLGLGFALGSVALAAAFVGAPVRALPLEDWLVFAAPAALLIFVQATGEELIFRGYLLQQIAARTASPWAWAVLPSLLFGCLHYSDTLPGAGGVFYILITFVTGLALAAAVWRTGALWAASGLHVGINAAGLLVVGSEGILSGTQLWLFPEHGLGGIFLVDLVASGGLLAFILSPAGRWLAPARLSRIR